MKFVSLNFWTFVNENKITFPNKNREGDTGYLRNIWGLLPNRDFRKNYLQKCLSCLG